MSPNSTVVTMVIRIAILIFCLIIPSTAKYQNRFYHGDTECTEFFCFHNGACISQKLRSLPSAEALGYLVTIPLAGLDVLRLKLIAHLRLQRKHVTEPNRF